MKLLHLACAADLLTAVSIPSPALSQGDTTVFKCLTRDSIFSVPHAVRDPFRPLAIYACGTYAPTDLLPSYWDSAFNPAIQLSVPKYYRDNSLGNYVLNSRAFGRDRIHRFTFTIPGADNTLSDDTAEMWFDQVMPKADSVINFPGLDSNFGLD